MRNRAEIWPDDIMWSTVLVKPSFCDVGNDDHHHHVKALRAVILNVHELDHTTRIACGPSKSVSLKGLISPKDICRALSPSFPRTRGGS